MNGGVWSAFTLCTRLNTDRFLLFWSFFQFRWFAIIPLVLAFSGAAGRPVEENPPVAAAVRSVLAMSPASRY